MAVTEVQHPVRTLKQARGWPPPGLIPHREWCFSSNLVEFTKYWHTPYRIGSILTGTCESLLVPVLQMSELRHTEEKRLS